MSHTRITTLAFFYFWSYLPFLSLNLDFLLLLCNTNTLRNILMMLGTNVEQDEIIIRVAYKNDNSGWIGWGGWGPEGAGIFVFIFLVFIFLVFILFYLFIFCFSFFP